MRYGLDVAQHQLDWTEILDRVRLAEDASFDGAWVFDHFKPLYGDRGGPCLEGWSVLAALASATERIRLGALVTGVTYRHPSVLAAQAVTVDQVSGGRLELGIGAAWFEKEHRELGIDFPSTRERAERLDEAVQVMTSLMTGERVSLDGRHYQLRNATYRPRPIQEPHPPVWIGARGDKLMLPVAARRADVWHCHGSVGELKRKSELIDRLGAQAGRDPASIGRATDLSISHSWDHVRKRATVLDEAGFSYLVVGWPSEGRARLEEFIEKVLPGLPS